MKMKKLTEYKLKNERNISPRNLLLIDNKLYIVFIFDKKGSCESKLICMDSKTLESLWVYDYPFIINSIQKSPTLNIVMTTMDGTIEEIDAQTGHLILSYKTQMFRTGWSSKIEDNKFILAGIQGTKIAQCINVHSKEIQWEFETNGHSYQPVISDKKVYIPTENRIRCLDFKTGQLIWENVENETYLLNIEPFKKFILASGHGLINFYCKDKGTLIHQINIGKSELETAINHIICEDDKIYFSVNCGKVFCYKIIIESNDDVFSESIWSFQASGFTKSEILISENLLILTSSDKKILILDKEIGLKTTELKLKESAERSSLLINDKNLFVAFEKGYVYRVNLL